MRCHPFPGIRLGPIAFAIAMVGLPTGAPAEPVLEEIIVTATKRSESMQSVPLNVSSISGEELRERGLTEFFDYAVTIPNLSFGAATDGILSNRTVSLRGIEGTNTTGYYIDDTPVTETIDPRILDLERIEVLRGPSGTLYGARSLGGTIRQVGRLHHAAAGFRTGRRLGPRRVVRHTAFRRPELPGRRLFQRTVQ